MTMTEIVIERTSLNAACRYPSYASIFDTLRRPMESALRAAAAVMHEAAAMR